MSNCQACGGYMFATFDEDVYECANCGTKVDVSEGEQ